MSTKPQPEKRFDKVVSGKVKIRKNEGRKIANLFLADDMSDIGSYLLFEVLIPTAKKTVLDIVDMMLYGTDRSSRRTRDRTERRIYRNYYDPVDSRNLRRGDRIARESRNRFDYDDLLFEIRGDAEAVKRQMFDAADEYGFVTVANMYDFADKTAPYTANNYGWVRDALQYIEVKRVYNGWILQLPKAMPID